MLLQNTSIKEGNNMKIHMNLSPSLGFVAASVLLLWSCSRQNDANQNDQDIVSQTENTEKENYNVPVSNGLSMELSLMDPEKRWVRVAWRNMQETNLILTLSNDFTFDDKKALTWPCFQFNVSKVPDRYPYATFTGFASIDNKPSELTSVLELNGMPLYKNDYPAQMVKHVELKPAEVVEVLFDLGSLFDGVEDDELDAITVWFGYDCGGREQEGDNYWRGSIDSNILKIKR